MRNQDLILAARKCRIVTLLCNTIGLPERLAVRLQPNHPTDDPKGIAASMLDGLLYGVVMPSSGSIRPVTPDVLGTLVRIRLTRSSTADIPTQSCVLDTCLNSLRMIESKVPVDLVFQSIAGTEKPMLALVSPFHCLARQYQAAPSLERGTLGDNVMYFETGQGSALSADAHHGLDQQT